MFTRVEVRNFRSLKDVSVSLSNFHVLVGANGSGKTTFLDVFSFMGDLLNKGIYEAVKARANNWDELTFNGSESNHIFFSFEAILPIELLNASRLSIYDSIRYEIQFSRVGGATKIGLEECHLFRSSDPPVNWGGASGVSRIKDRTNREEFLDPNVKAFTIVHRFADCLINSTDELEEFGLTLADDSFALNNIPEDLRKFPVTTWLKNQFKNFIQPIEINSNAINKAGKEGRPGTVNPDGSNLPWLIDSLKKNPDRYEMWMDHVRGVLPEIAEIRTVAREDQGDKFLIIKYKEGNEVKSWLVSDGTLRILLLTIIPYNLDLQGLFLIESPDTEINPQAMQSVMDSLRSVYEGQVLATTHSPEAVNCVRKKELLIFTKDKTGATEIVSGLEHPYLKDSTEDLGSAVFYGAGTMR